MKSLNSVDNKSVKEKIKTPFVRIIVSGTIESPYFEILYLGYDHICIGFGSYDLNQVFRWLKEEFEFSTTHSRILWTEDICNDAAEFVSKNTVLKYIKSVKDRAIVRDLPSIEVPITNFNLAKNKGEDT